MMFNRPAYDKFLIEKEVIGFYDSPVTLRSGGKTYWYANFRTLLADIKLVDRMAEYIWDFAIVDTRYVTNALAIPEGPREFASAFNRMLLQSTGKIVPATSLRSGYKTHGSAQDRFSVGALNPNSKPLLIEDVTTTGNSSSEHIYNLQVQGILPVALVSLCNRRERRHDGKLPKDFIEKVWRTPYFDMTGADTLLPTAVEMLNPAAEILGGLREELGDLKRYAVEIKV